MAHELEITDGKARFAYADYADPWHHLGQPMEGLQTLDAMMEASQTDYEVFTSKVAAVDDDGNLILNTDGTPVIIEDSRATVRRDIDGTLGGLTTVGTRYFPTQNRRVAERAEAIVQAAAIDPSLGLVAWDTMGSLFGGRRFFALLCLDPIILDPTGIDDKILRYLGIYNGHDGKVPETYANTDVRWVCNNTVTLGLQTAPRTFKARHTQGNADLDMKEAQRVLGMSSKWAEEFAKTAEKMLAIDFTKLVNPFDRVLNVVWPENPEATDKQAENRDEILTVVRGLYHGPKNVGKAGENGWSAWNAIVEYLDHHRAGDPDARAYTSMDDTSWVSKAKIKAQGAVLALAN